MITIYFSLRVWYTFDLFYGSLTLILVVMSGGADGSETVSLSAVGVL